jgi:hypothetical protein
MTVIDLTSPEMEEQTESPALQRVRSNNERNRPPIIVKKKPALNNRNTDTRFDLTRKRRATTTNITVNPKLKTAKPKKSRSGGKKECDLGVNCPYKDEFQHQQEFAHSNDISAEVSFKGNGNKLGGSTKTGNRTRVQSSSSSSNSVSAFGASGYKLGGNANLHHGASSSHHLENTEPDTEYVECAHCTNLVELGNYDRHLQTHEDNQLGNTAFIDDGNMYSNGNHYIDNSYSNNTHFSTTTTATKPHASSSLMKQQDEEFEKSEIEDLMKMHGQQGGEGTAALMPSYVPPAVAALEPVERIHEREVIDIDDDDDDADILDEHTKYNSSSSSPSSLSPPQQQQLPRRRTHTPCGPRVTLAFKFKFSAAPGAGTPPPRGCKVVQAFHVDSSLQVGYLTLALLCSALVS